MSKLEKYVLIYALLFVIFTIGLAYRTGWKVGYHAGILLSIGNLDTNTTGENDDEDQSTYSTEIADFTELKLQIKNYTCSKENKIILQDS